MQTQPNQPHPLIKGISFTAPQDDPAQDLASLSNRWITTKNDEDQAKAKRLKIESEIESLLDKPANGEGSVKTDTGLTVKFAISRTVDSAALTAGWVDMSENAQKCFRWKGELSAKEFNAAREMAPSVYAEVAKYVTSKPSKPSFTFKEKAE